MSNQGKDLRWRYFTTAFVTGAVVMALEILGSRLLAPVFGNSLFVWGALIGVILAAMSSGYAAGGWIADRYRGGGVLATLLLTSGSWTLLLAWIGQPVMFTVAEWLQDPRWGPCLAGAVLLAPPAFALSGVLPALLRLSVEDMGHLGRHSGGMIAVSTIGSLAGTWGTAFYLLTWLGSYTLVAMLGCVQLLLGLLWWRWAVQLGFGVLVPTAGTLSLIAWLGFHPVHVLPEPLYQEESPYQQIRVRDDDLFRYLILDRTFHAVMWRMDPVSLFLPYSQIMVAALALHPDPREALVLGHGGGSFGKWLGKYWPGLELDLVEVDPSVVRVAEEYFGYEPRRNHRVFVQDARTFLRSTDRQYDIIWVDVFARDLIPFHLTTQEFFQEVTSHLDEGGVLAVNLATSQKAGDTLRAQSVVATMKTVFPTITTFRVEGPWGPTPSEAVNLVFFAGSPTAHVDHQEVKKRVHKLVQEGRLPREAERLLDTRRTKPWEGGIILTDDYAPFDLLMGSGA